MRSSDSSRAFILEQLAGVGDLVPRAMFGGLGLYADGVFFGLVARDRLYLKVDDSNRARFEAAGSAPFKPYAGRPMTMNYWDVPPDVLEDSDELLAWAKASVAIARAALEAPKVRSVAKQRKPVARKVATGGKRSD